MATSERRSSCRGNAGDSACEERRRLLERILQLCPCSTLEARWSLRTWVLLSSCCSPQLAPGMVGPPAPRSRVSCHSGAVLGCGKDFLGVWYKCSIAPGARRDDSLGWGNDEVGLRDAWLPVLSTKSLLWAGTVPASGDCYVQLLLRAGSRSLSMGREQAREHVCSLARQGRDTSLAFSAD